MIGTISRCNGPTDVTEIVPDLRRLDFDDACPKIPHQSARVVTLNQHGALKNPDTLEEFYHEILGGG
jgi:hypothetical protein